MTWIFLAFFLFLLSLLSTYLIRIFSLKKNILDVPNFRSLHQKPIPRGGGLAFVFLFYGALIFLFLENKIPFFILMSLLGGIPVALVGYCDDVVGVKAKWRALVHLLSALWGLSFLGGMSVLFFVFAAVTTVWFVNLYNFMDGIDGLAGTEAVFVSLVAGCVLLATGVDSMAFVCFALTFSVLGFLVFNWPPAKIFMGDVGSGFLGYIFAMLMWITNSHHQLSFPFWCILLSVFIIDATYTLIYSIIQRKKWWSAHCEHAYQRLTQSGLTHRKTTLSIVTINLFVCFPIAMIYIKMHSNTIPVLYLMLVSLGFWFVWFMIIKKSNDMARKLVNDQS